MDAIDQAILTQLHQDARTSLKELGERVGLSSPSVSERLRRLEERGVVRAFTVDIEPRALGYQQVLSAMDGACTIDFAAEETKRATRRFVRRQRSWFRRDQRITWLDGARPDLLEAAGNLVPWSS